MALLRRALAITAVTFGATSLYGYVTKKDLSPFATFFFMATIGLLVAKAKGIDLRATGSGNIGATNAGRALGRAAAQARLSGKALERIVGEHAGDTTDRARRIAGAAQSPDGVDQ